jgi:hypothetical protein
MLAVTSEESANIPYTLEGGSLAGGYQKDDRVTAGVAHGQVAVGDAGTVIGPCTSQGDDGARRVCVEFDGGKGQINYVASSQIRFRARRLEARSVGRPTKNSIVRINARSNRSGSLGVIIQDDHDEKPFKVRFADDVTKWYTESEVQWYGKAEVRTRGTNVGDDLQALACLATVVGGVVHFAGSRDVGGAALRAGAAAAQGFVMDSAADFVAEELAVAGFSLAAAAVLGAETGMILGPAGMAVGAAGAVAVEVAAGLGLAEALCAADAFGVGPVGLAASVLCTIS